MLCANATAQPSFQLPLKGEPGKDYIIGYYADHDPDDGIQDAYCGSKTYNHHPGTDFVIRSFKTMDTGVYVYAIADGIVFGTKDGLPDRNKKPVAPLLGNHAAILHYSKYKTYYGQLQKYSLMVKMGDSVKAGQIIGRVGSSGYSSFPHLHLELHDEAAIVDPFAGNCNDGTNLWASPPPYDTGISVFDQGFVPYVPAYASLAEHTGVTDSFTTADTTICYWLLVLGLHPGHVTRVEWYEPGGSLYYTFNDTVQNNRWFTYDWAYIGHVKKTGTWHTMYYVNNKLLATRNFYVQKRRKGR